MLCRDTKTRALDMESTCLCTVLDLMPHCPHPGRANGASGLRLSVVLPRLLWSNLPG